MATTQYSIKIDGMTCGGCTASVQRALQALDGVSSISISLADGLAVVGYQDELINIDSIVTAIEDAGFDVTDCVKI